MNQQLKKIFFGSGDGSQNGQQLGPESVKLLKELVEKYPYFQTARLFYAKALHDQQSIHADEAIRLAALYAADRSVLKNLIEQKQEVAREITKEEKPAYIEKEIPAPQQKALEEIPPIEVKPVEQPVSEIKEDRFFEISDSQNEPAKEQKPLQRNPHDIIRERLSEILSFSADEIKKPGSISKAEKDGSPAEAEKSITQFDTVEQTASPREIPAPTSVSQQEPLSQQIDSAKEEELIVKQAGEAKDILDTMELEYAMEESILASLEKLPPIEPVKKESLPPKPEPPSKNIPEIHREEISNVTRESIDEFPNSFTGWLKKMSTGPFFQYEELHSRTSLKKHSAKTVEQQPNPKTIGDLPEEDSTDDENLSDDELINKFIETEPKIVPSKAEFYSPANQAKKSVMEHEDTVSETLAAIYLEQGNYPKAQWCYEKLLLLNPEKSSYFAALLEKAKEAEAKGKSS